MPRRGENIYKRKDGRWEGRYRNHVGITKYHSVYGKTYNEVKTKLISLRNIPVEFNSSGKLTVNVLFEEWLSAVKLRVKESSYANYKTKIDKHILPCFADDKYENITATKVHFFIEEKINSGLSAKYVSDIIVVFKSMARYMSKVHGFKNVLENVVMPKISKKETVLLSKNEQSLLCNYINSDLNNTSLGIFLSYYAGLRIGEICGLKWEDIDFEKGIINVNRTVQRIRKSNGGTKIVVGSPKSKTSVRSIPIPEFLMKLLLKFRDNNSFYILSNSTKITEPRTLQRRFKMILKKANVTSVNFHSLRHMFATNCLNLGFDVKTLSELLGHSSAVITLNRYVHSSMERKIQCMNLFRMAE